ncbi:MAG: hypothetical protein DCC65_15860 [Planctomycetota bacterium]|nr:MAG: hypothetical protein DCC65_15860 [Planctomycetota bacterium]
MISLSLVRRTIRDYLLIGSAVFVVICGFVVLFNFALDAFPRQQTQNWIEVPWVRKFIVALVGADVMELTKPEGMLSIAFSHPLVWVLLVSFTLTLASGVLAGEVDRGTTDLLAALPLSRPAIYSSVSVSLLLMGLPLCWAVWLGAKIGIALTGFAEVRMSLLAIVTCNLCAAFVSISGLALMISAASSRRGMAVALAFGILFYSFVINFLATLWPALQAISFTSFLSYYAPLMIIREEVWPWRHMGTLLATGAVLWAAGLVVFIRRDIPAH